MEFDDIKFIDVSETHGNNAIQAIVKFKDNSHSMSIVRHAGSYGFELHRYEIGIFKGNDMVCFPPITHDSDQVRGYVKPHQIAQYIKKMSTMLEAEPYQDI